MMSDALGVIYTGDNDHYLQELTHSRGIAAMPIYARYRLIDFFLSNLVNSGIRNVGVITQKNYHSVMGQHLRRPRMGLEPQARRIVYPAPVRHARQPRRV